MGERRALVSRAVRISHPYAERLQRDGAVTRAEPAVGRPRSGPADRECATRAGRCDRSGKPERCGHPRSRLLAGGARWPARPIRPRRLPFRFSRGCPLLARHGRAEPAIPRTFPSIPPRWGPAVVAQQAAHRFVGQVHRAGEGKGSSRLSATACSWFIGWKQPHERVAGR